MSKVHQYIADAAQLKGIRDGAITQVWVPIDFSSMGSWWARNTIKRVYQPGTEHWAVEADCNFRLYEGGFTCPYAVGDELVPQRELRLKIDESEQIPYRTITSIEAKTLGEMTGYDAAASEYAYRGLDRGRNRDHPEQPWGGTQWVWVLGIETTAMEKE